ncbi:endonuclease/exonuclease/phosphatase family protein [Myceligenerans xiligouense]|uniref:Endonuclease/exonuclease/phosphatase (EEP) superfamily protein YafD n=1 Tax=Myceligenerans xiligouense TaxID=253184 RepID=A0A3N4YJ81_9MICO|nr:endonuclease/exonuclease/phosphatase family protein [Myceligenerans xiligouense]RPF21199.1 endonuclease/exonuclease/phosphatase (EEP) superfamily protein YafD [Myceligenerans xiligouense]
MADPIAVAVVAACAACVVVALLDLLLNGRWWFWLVLSLVPPPALVLAPALLLVAAVAAGGPYRPIAVVASLLCLVAGYRRSGIDLGAVGRDPAVVTSERELKVCVWNTEHWYQQGDPEPFYAFLRSLDADVLMLQEYHHDNHDGTWAAIDDIARLRTAFPGRHVVADHGQVTISRLPARHVPTVAERVLRVDVDVPGRTGTHRVSLLNVHVPVQLRRISPFRREFYREVRARAGHREREFAALAADVAGIAHPLLVAGDFNTSPAMADARRVRSLGEDAARTRAMVFPRSWHARGPRLWRIDWALTRNGLEVHEYRFAEAAGLSDHRVQHLTVGVGTRHRSHHG